MRTYVFFFFSSFIDTLFLLCDSKPCTYDIIYIYDEVVITVLSPISTCVVYSLSLRTWFLFIVSNLLFLFHTKMPWVLFEVFQKYRLSKSSCHELSSCKVFQEFVLGYILLYSTNEYKLSDLYDFSHMFICLLWFCHGLPKKEIVRTYVNHVRNICQYRIG